MNNDNSWLYRRWTGDWAQNQSHALDPSADPLVQPLQLLLTKGGGPVHMHRLRGGQENQSHLEERHNLDPDSRGTGNKRGVQEETDRVWCMAQILVRKSPKQNETEIKPYRVIKLCTLPIQFPKISQLKKSSQKYFYSTICTVSKQKNNLVFRVQ